MYNQIFRAWSSVIRWLTRKDDHMIAIRHLRFLAYTEGVSEFEILRQAYRETCRTDIHPTHLNAVFKEYLLIGRVPIWARAYAYNVSEMIEDEVFLSDYMNSAKH